MSLRQAKSLTLFHGTNQVFDRFDPTKVGRRDSGNLGRGIYLTKDPTFAMRYAEENTQRWGGTPTVLKVRASLGRIAPFYKLIPQLKAIGVKFPPVANDVKRSELLRQWFMDQGYDAAEAGNEIVVFDHRKLKVLGVESVPTEQERLQAILRHFQETGETITEQELLSKRLARRFMKKRAMKEDIHIHPVALRMAQRFLAPKSKRAKTNGWEKYVKGSLKKAKADLTKYAKNYGGDKTAVKFSITQGRLNVTLWLDLATSSTPSFGKVPPPTKEETEEAKELARIILGPAFTKVEPHKGIPGMWVAWGYDDLAFLL